MFRPDSRRLLVAAVVALSLVGLWLGHTVEYVRVWGSAGLQTEMAGSIHAYMLPVGALLAAAAALAGRRLWHAWAALGRRLDAARLALPALLRGRRVQLPAALGTQRPSLAAGVAVVWPALTALQVALYVAQENIEASLAGYRGPGLGAITGVHALAPAVHAGVGLVLLVATALALRLLRRRVDVVAAIEATLRTLLAVLRGRAPRALVPTAPVLRPVAQLLRHSLRQRPPPALLVTG